MSNPVYRCAAVKTNGCQCNAPALTDHDFCYFHHHQHQRALRQSRLPSLALSGPAQPPPLTLALPPLEDADAIQVSISLVAAALAANQIEPRRASILLYALQVASSNIRVTGLSEMRRAVTGYVVKRNGAILADGEPTLIEDDFILDDDEDDDEDDFDIEDED